MARPKLTRIFNAPDKLAGQTDGRPNGVLSSLFRKIMIELEVGAEKWGYLMRNYVTDPRNGVAHNRKERTSARGNLSAAFSHESMTWKVFCKALRFFQIWKVVIVFELHTQRDGVKIVSHEMTLNAPQGPNDLLSLSDLNKCAEHIHAEDLGDEAFDVYDITMIEAGKLEDDDDLEEESV